MPKRAMLIPSREGWREATGCVALRSVKLSEFALWSETLECFGS